MIITWILLKQIHLLSNFNSNNYINLYCLLNNISYYIGGVLTNNLKLLNSFDEKIKTNNYLYNYVYSFNKNNIEFNKYVVKITNHNSIKYYPSIEHGWLNYDTKLALKYIIKKFKSKILVELGSWFGNSAIYIKNIDPSIKLFCFDKFQNINESRFIISKYNSIDKFYFTYNRFEVFYKNMINMQ